MPYIANSQYNTDQNGINPDDEYQQNMTRYGQAIGIPGSATGPGSGWAYGGASTQPGGTTASGGLGGGPNGKFVNFEQYMNANQGGAKKMDQSLTNDLTSQANAANKEVQGAQSQFAKDAGAGVGWGPVTTTPGTPGTPGESYGQAATDAGKKPYYWWKGVFGNQERGPGVGPDGTQAPKGGQPYFGDPSQPGASPSPGVPGDPSGAWDPGTIARVQALMNGTPGTPGTSSAKEVYNGPQSMGSDANINSQQIMQDVGNASAGINATGTQGGLQGLFQSKYGGQGDYGAGDSAFDAALGGAFGSSQFGGLRSMYSGLGNAFNAAEGGDQGVINSAMANGPPNDYNVNLPGPLPQLATPVALTPEQQQEQQNQKRKNGQ